MKKTLLAFIFLAFPAWAYDPFQAESAVYKIEARAGGQMNVGTGVLIARDKILTNCHVVKKPGAVPFAISRKTGNTFRALRYYNLGGFDACVLEGIFSDGQPVQMTNRFDSGQQVWYYGYPAGVFVSGHGPILRTLQTSQGNYTIESGAFCHPGSSGGPLLNAGGELVGLNFGVRTEGNQTLCLSIPAFAFWNMIQF